MKLGVPEEAMYKRNESISARLPPCRESQQDSQQETHQDSQQDSQKDSQQDSRQDSQQVSKRVTRQSVQEERVDLGEVPPIPKTDGLGV